MTDPDPTLAVVRRITALTATELSDADITGFLTDNGGSPRLAAADALEAFAGTLLDVTDAEGFTVSGSKRAATLMARAKSLREQATDDGDSGTDDDFYFGVADSGADCRPELTPGRSW